MREAYMLVEFIDDVGIKRSIDIVPAGWIFFDEKKNHLVAPFIQDSSKTNLEILTSLVKCRGQPLPSWPIHRVSIKGSAGSYAEALKKAKALEVQPYVFSTDNEEHVAAKQDGLLKKYKMRGKKYDENGVKELFAGAAMSAPFRNDGDRDRLSSNKNLKKPPKLSKKNLSTRKHQQSIGVQQKLKHVKSTSKELDPADSDNSTRSTESSRSCKSDNNDDHSAQNSESHSDSNNNGAARKQGSNFHQKKGKDNPPHQMDHSKKYGDSLELNDIDDSNDNGKAHKNVGHSYQKTGKDDMPHQMNPSKKYEHLLKFIDIDDDDDTKTIILKVFRKLSLQIGQIQSELADLKISQIKTSSIKQQEVLKGIDAVIEKYNFEGLPFTTFEKFIEFDEKLKATKAFKMEIIRGMSALINPNCKWLTTSIRDIIKKFMTRDVLLNFTSVKKSGDKIIFKDETTFYVCVRDAILTEFHDGAVKEKDISDAFGAVINNAKDWGGRERKTTEK